jgi:hypothetical protein
MEYGTTRNAKVKTISRVEIITADRVTRNGAGERSIEDSFVLAGTNCILRQAA